MLDEEHTDIELAMYYIKTDCGYVKRPPIRTGRNDWDYEEEDNYDRRNYDWE